MTQRELVKRINEEEKIIGWKTQMKVQHLNNMLKNNYISKLRAMKIERALGMEDGTISDLVTSQEKEVELYKERCKLCKNINK